VKNEADDFMAAESSSGIGISTLEDAARALPSLKWKPSKALKTGDVWTRNTEETRRRLHIVSLSFAVAKSPELSAVLYLVSSVTADQDNVSSRMYVDGGRLCHCKSGLWSAGCRVLLMGKWVVVVC
jgi:hypothetical protein